MRIAGCWPSSPGRHHTQQGGQKCTRSPGGLVRASHAAAPRTSSPTRECASTGRVWSRAMTLACSPPSTVGSLPVRALPTARTHQIGRPTPVRAALRAARMLGRYPAPLRQLIRPPVTCQVGHHAAAAPLSRRSTTTPTARRPAVHSVAWWAGESFTRRRSPHLEPDPRVREYRTCLVARYDPRVLASQHGREPPRESPPDGSDAPNRPTDAGASGPARSTHSRELSSTAAPADTAFRHLSGGPPCCCCALV